VATHWLKQLPVLEAGVIQHSSPWNGHDAVEYATLEWRTDLMIVGY